jgi:hypothetical protein
VSEQSRPKVNWQPICALSLIGSMIDDLLDDAEQQYEALGSCRAQPHVLDDYTVGRVIKAYTEQADDVRLYAEQLSRWSGLNLTPSQRQEVDRLSEQIPRIRERISIILALAAELKGRTIDTVLGKSDLSEALPLQSEWKVNDIESGLNSTLDPYTAYLGQVTHERLIVILCDATTA